MIPDTCMSLVLKFNVDESHTNSLLNDVPHSILVQHALRRALGFSPPSTPGAPLGLQNRGPPLARLHTPRALVHAPYRDAISVATWNSQGFFAQAGKRHREKAQYALQLLRKYDAVMLTETHGTPGRADSWASRRDLTPYWSHGSASTAGVGLLVSQDLISSFSQVEWVVIETGRAGVLRMDGPAGSLDLIVVYFPTGSGQATFDNADETDQVPMPVQRARLRAKIGHALRPSTTSLTVVAGDFNWVTEPGDRSSLHNAVASGARDSNEERHWLQQTGRVHLHEVHQPAMTHRSAQALSRLDRVYWNQGLSEQLDRQIFSAALPWTDGLSAHRAVVAGRRLPGRKIGSDHPALSPINVSTVKGTEWAHRVRLELQHRASDLQDGTPLQNLQVVKEVMRQVALNMEKSRWNRQVNPEDQEDTLCTTMRFLRAAERGHLTIISKCLECYPKLRELVRNPYAPDISEHGGLEAVREHAVDLARQHTINEMRRLHEDLPGLGEQEAQIRRGRTWRLLARLSPGKCAALSSVVGQDGTTHTDAAGMAGALRGHWRQVFADKGLSQALATRWLHEEAGRDRARKLPHRSSDRWKVTQEDMRQAIRLSPSSSPGPDGIPFAAWRAISDIAVPLLQAVYEQLAAGGADEAHAADIRKFNEGLMVFLPKDPSGVDVHGCPMFLPADTRPLSIGNADNRLIASAVQHRIEPILGRWVTKEQRGFINGRSMLANVVDIDESMQSASLEREQGVAIFLDFAAAFPSLSHKFIHVTLRELGIPEALQHYVAALYFQNCCKIKVCGTIQDGFDIAAGIRQGCPLSPLLFAVISNLVIRRVRSLAPEVLIRAYADDIAMVLPAGPPATGVLEQIFAEYASFSGLRLNFRKCVVVPLAPDQTDQYADLIGRYAPTWYAMKFETQAKYLGFS